MNQRDVGVGSGGKSGSSRRVYRMNRLRTLSFTNVCTSINANLSSCEQARGNLIGVTVARSSVFIPSHILADLHRL